MKIAVIVKPPRTHKQRLTDELALLQQGLPGADIRILESEYAGHAIELSRAATADADCIIAAGGDGTLNEVVNGCLQAQHQNPEIKPPLVAVLAYGTANDFIKSAGLSGRMEQLISMLAAGHSRRIDVGYVHYREASGKPAERYFLNEASVGIGADVARRVNRGRRRLGATLTFIRSILLTFRKYRKPLCSVSSDTQRDREGRLLALVAANGRYFGSGLCIAPRAELDDGKLSCTRIGDVTIQEFLQNLRRLKRGIAIAHPQVSYATARKIEVSTINGPCPVEADGEFLGYTPARVEVLPRRLRLLM